MNGIPTYDELVSECTEDLKIAFSDEGGFNDYDSLQRMWFHATLMYLKTDPVRILEIAKQNRKSVETVLKACAVYLGSEANISENAKKIMAKFMLNYEDYKTSAGSKSRFKQHPINIQIIFMVYSLLQKYDIAPTRGEGTATQFSGCDIAAAACVKNKLNNPTSYEGVKHVWNSRKTYFPGYASDEEMFNAILLDLPTYIKRIALADSK